LKRFTTLSTNDRVISCDCFSGGRVGVRWGEVGGGGMGGRGWATFV